MLASVAEVPTFVARKEAFGPRLKDLILPGSHHLHVSLSGCFVVMMMIAAEGCVCPRRHGGLAVSRRMGKKARPVLLFGVFFSRLTRASFWFVPHPPPTLVACHAVGYLSLPR